MFSVICPTMWYGKELYLLLPLLDQCPHVGEIVLINNDSKQTPKWFVDTYWQKVLTLTPPKNLYVNPSFNLGVRAAKYDQLAIIQDDILFHTDIFEKMIPLITPENGCYGTDGRKLQFAIPNTFEMPSELEFEIDPSPKNCGVPNWLSVLMFFHKSNWNPINEQMKIHFGEQWLTYYHFKMGKPVRLIANFPVYCKECNRTTSKISNPVESTHCGCQWIRDQMGV